MPPKSHSLHGLWDQRHLQVAATEVGFGRASRPEPGANVPRRERLSTDSAAAIRGVKGCCAVSRPPRTAWVGTVLCAVGVYGWPRSSKSIVHHAHARARQPPRNAGAHRRGILTLSGRHPLSGRRRRGRTRLSCMEASARYVPLPLPLALPAGRPAHTAFTPNTKGVVPRCVRDVCGPYGDIASGDRVGAQGRVARRAARPATSGTCRGAFAASCECLCPKMRPTL